MEANPQEQAAPIQQTSQVETGLGDGIADTAIKLNEVLTPEQPAPSTEPINLAIPDEKPQRFQFAVGDEEAAVPEDFKPIPAASSEAEPAPKAENARDRAEREFKEASDARISKVLNMRREGQHPQAEQSKPMPVPPGVAEQTRLEQAAGQKMNEHHAALRGMAHHPFNSPAVDPRDGKMVPVFRPEAYTQPPLKTAAADHVPTKTAQPL